MPGQIRSTATGRTMLALVAAAVLFGGAVTWQVMGKEPPAAKTNEPLFHVTGGTPEQIGRYLVSIGGCNDCHTPGFDQNPNVPEADWLIGTTLGYKGPWGTTYASNLRLTVDSLTERGWVTTLRSRTSRPPMPWASMHAMSDSDLRAIYAYIKSLGVKGERAPIALPPGEAPKTPYLVFEPVMPSPAP